MSNELRLNCLILGHENSLQNIVTVNISRDKNVGDMKTAIKAELQPALDHCAVTRLVLWQDLDGSLEEELGEDPSDGRRFKQLFPLERLAKVFVDQPDQKQLHIRVQVLPLGDSDSLFVPIA